MMSLLSSNLCPKAAAELSPLSAEEMRSCNQQLCFKAIESTGVVRKYQTTKHGRGIYIYIYIHIIYIYIHISIRKHADFARKISKHQLKPKMFLKSLGCRQ